MLVDEDVSETWPMAYTAEVVERWATGLTMSWLLVGTHVSNGANSSFWQLPTQKAKTRWATCCASGELAIGHVYACPSKTTDACVTDKVVIIWSDLLCRTCARFPHFLFIFLYKRSTARMNQRYFNLKAFLSCLLRWSAFWGQNSAPPVSGINGDYDSVDYTLRSICTKELNPV